MNAKFALKALVVYINNIKELSPAGANIYIDPWEVNGLDYRTVDLTLSKLAQDFGVINIVNIPSDAPDGNTSHYEPFDGRHEYEQGHYGIKLLEKYDEFAQAYTLETEPIEKLPEYLSYYIQLMLKAIDSLNISEQNQPPKNVIEHWFERTDPSLS